MSALVDQTLAYWVYGGPLLLPLALVCYGIWFYVLKTRRILVEALQHEKEAEVLLLDHLSPESIAACRRALTEGRDLLSSMLSDTLRDIHRGAPPSEAFDACTAWVMRGLTRDFVMVAALTAVAPLLGLLGTVQGMITTFSAVAQATAETGGQVAAGIGQALITTQFGLVIAIPGLFGLSWLRRLTRHFKRRLALFKTHLLLGLQQPSVEVSP